MRLRTMPWMPPFWLPDTSHRSSRLALSSAKAVVALKISTKIEISAAIQPPPDSWALASTVWITSAPRSPVRSRSDANSSERTASSPKKAPATAITRISIGASENTMYKASAAPLLEARWVDHWLAESINRPPISDGRRARRLLGRRMGLARAREPSL